MKPFKKHHIEFKNHPDFYEKNKINPTKESNISIVLNYLKLLKSGEINRQDVTVEIFLSKILNITLFSGIEYDLLIKEFFLNKFPSNKILPNFGQIEMFCDLLKDLMHNFQNFPKLQIDKIKSNIKAFPYLETIREKIFKSYLEFVIKFTSFSYEAILENQELAAKHQKQLGIELTYDQKKELIEKINKKRNIITYDDIRPGIILFNNIPNTNIYRGLEECTILTTYTDADKEYNELNDFYEKYLHNLTLYNLQDFGLTQFLTE